MRPSFDRVIFALGVLGIIVMYALGAPAGQFLQRVWPFLVCVVCMVALSYLGRNRPP